MMVAIRVINRIFSLTIMKRLMVLWQFGLLHRCLLYTSIMKDLKAQATEKGYHYVDWNVCADDAIGGHPSAEKIYNNVIRDVGDKHRCIVLMHDTKATQNTAAALPDIIRWFKNAGYRFDTVDHLEREI